MKHLQLLAPSRNSVAILSGIGGSVFLSLHPGKNNVNLLSLELTIVVEFVLKYVHVDKFCSLMSLDVFMVVKILIT